MTSELLLPGLDGSNPLAFLAALGTFRTLSLARSGIRLSWRSAGTWQPVLHCTETLSEESVLQLLDVRLRDKDGQKAFALDNDLKVTSKRFREDAEAAAQSASPTDRVWADFMAAFGCDAVCNDEGFIQDTALRTMSGAGHQHFLKFMRDLAAGTDADHLQRALFQRWDYADAGPSLRWDPSDDRRYALRWDEPSGDPIRTMRGANRLAVEALPLLPTAPAGSNLYTTGFSGRGSRDTFWTWPIWETPLPVDPVRSLLSLAELQESEPPRAKLAARGITEVFRSQRLTIGKYRNFTPAKAV